MTFSGLDQFGDRSWWCLLPWSLAVAGAWAANQVRNPWLRDWLVIESADRSIRVQPLHEDVRGSYRIGFDELLHKPRW